MGAIAACMGNRRSALSAASYRVLSRITLVIYEARLESCRRLKDDYRHVRNGMEWWYRREKLHGRRPGELRTSEVFADCRSKNANYNEIVTLKN